MGTLDPVVADALNRQITNERQNSAIYLAIGNRFDVMNLTGLAKFARENAAEELTHAARFTDYVVDRYGTPIVDALEAVNPPAPDMMTAARVLFSLALLREQKTTEQIKTIYSLADEADDPQTCQMLLWFLEEQTKSEREFSELVAQATLAEGCPAAILALDAKLGGD
jgi:ferritin